MNERRGRTTFATLDREKGLPEPNPTIDEEYPLPAWYRAVRETPLDKLGVEDICKACHQQIHLEHVVPVALQLLQSDPVAGEMYDGELLASLKSIPVDYWSNHLVEATTLKSTCEQIQNKMTLSDDLHTDVAYLLNRVVARSG
jgi:hypothetical protein